MATLYSRHPNRDRPTRQSQSECHIVRKMIRVPLSRVSRHLGLCFGVHRRDHGGLDLRCNLACLCRSTITPLLAASASPVGMWATRLRCPSEAAYPQPSPPPRSCRCRRATPIFPSYVPPVGATPRGRDNSWTDVPAARGRMLQIGSSLMATVAEIAEASEASSLFRVKAA